MSRPKRRGKPPLAGDIISLIRKIAKENRSWGAERIRGELLKPGVQVSKSTVLGERSGRFAKLRQ